MRRACDCCSTRRAASLFRSWKLFHDRVDDPRVHRLDSGGKNRGDMAIAADEIFVKVPARRFERTLIRRPFVEGMRVRSLKLCFCSKREADAVFAVRRLYDVVRTAGLLAAEIVRRHTDDHQPALMIARPKLLQAGILGCVPAERSRVDDED